MYDSKNIFAQIIAGHLPAQKIYEDEQMLIIHDIQPAAEQHYIAMPKGSYIDFQDFITNALPDQILHYWQMIAKVAKQQATDKHGGHYRLVSNIGSESGQTIFHFHTHILIGMSQTNLINQNI